MVKRFRVRPVRRCSTYCKIQRDRALEIAVRLRWRLDAGTAPAYLHAESAESPPCDVMALATPSNSLAKAACSANATCKAASASKSAPQASPAPQARPALQARPATEGRPALKARPVLQARPTTSCQPRTPATPQIKLAPESQNPTPAKVSAKQPARTALVSAVPVGTKPDVSFWKVFYCLYATEQRIITWTVCCKGGQPTRKLYCTDRETPLTALCHALVLIMIISIIMVAILA